MQEQTNPQIQFKTYKQYAEAATRTLNAVNLNHDLLHMGLGVSSEYFELKKALKKKDYINVAEEIGDAQWFLVNHLMMVYKYEPLKLSLLFEKLTVIWFKPQHAITTVAEEIDMYEDLLEEYTDLTKRHGAYFKQIEGYDTKLFNLIINIAKVHVNIILQTEAVKPKECLERNIQKLLDRFPTKFDQFLAMNRDLVKERKTLEGGVQA